MSNQIYEGINEIMEFTISRNEFLNLGGGAEMSISKLSYYM